MSTSMFATNNGERRRGTPRCTSTLHHTTIVNDSVLLDICVANVDEGPPLLTMLQMANTRLPSQRNYMSCLCGCLDRMIATQRLDAKISPCKLYLSEPKTKSGAW